MRFIVYGAGAIGGVVGGRMVQAGEAVVFIARGDHLVAMQRDGLTLEDAEASVTLPVDARGHANEVDWRDDDVVLLAVKSQHTIGVLDDIRLVAPGVPICCLQNGVENERVALRLFADVYAVVVMLPATHLEPGVVQAHSIPTTGILDLGRYPSGVDDTATHVSAAFAGSTFASVPRPDVMRWKYRKLVLNLGNAVEALTGDRTWSSPLVRGAIKEGEAVLAAAGIEVASREEDAERRGDLISLRDVGGVARGGGSSWQSLQRGAGSIETDYLSGEIVRLGRIHGVDTPVNALLQREAAAVALRGDGPGSLGSDELLARL